MSQSTLSVPHFLYQGYMLLSIKKNLTKSEKSYFIIEREAQEIVELLKHWRKIIYTNNRSEISGLYV